MHVRWGNFPRFGASNGRFVVGGVAGVRVRGLGRLGTNPERMEEPQWAKEVPALAVLPVPGEEGTQILNSFPAPEQLLPWLQEGNLRFI